MNEQVAATVEKSRVFSRKANEGDGEARKNAEEEYRKALMLAMELQVLDRVK
ncbi:MAG: hypothetical protein OEW04_07555 [Nitrospirota bacterium]|nr:hypothetical protein [Nitrospirota bacterium]